MFTLQAGKQHAAALGVSENQRGELLLSDVHHQLTTGGGKPGQGYPAVLSFEPRYARNGRGAPDTVVPPLKAQSGQTGKGDGAACVAYGISNQPTPKIGADIAPSLDAKENGGGRMECVAFHTAGFGAAVGEQAATLQASDARLSNQVSGVIAPYGVRRLLPVECERLQGLPDNWTRWAADGSEISDSARYRMLGNAVTVNVAEWIGRRIV